MSSVSDNIRNDPLLYNLFSTGTTTTFNKENPFNWIKIPTGLESEKNKTTTIGFLSVNTYSPDECSKILAALQVPEGKDISFSNEGHIGVGYSRYSRLTNFFPNPIAPRSDSRPFSVTNSLFHKVLNNWGATFYYNEKILFSPNLKWILYQIPNKYYNDSVPGAEISSTETSTSVPVYVLLYNTVHRKNFQKIYSQLINESPNSGAFNNATIAGINTNYLSTIKKYCNAFAVEKYTSSYSGRKLSHYGDPSCNLAFDTHQAKMSLVLSANITNHSLKNYYYKNGRSGYNAVSREFDIVDITSPYCGYGSGYSPGSFIRQVSNIVGVYDSESFVQPLINLFLSQNAKGNYVLPNGWNPLKPGDTTSAIACASKDLNFVQCKIEFSSAGELSASNAQFNNYCGNKPDVPQTQTPDVPQTQTQVVPQAQEGVGQTDTSENYQMYLIIALIIIFLIILLIYLLY